MKIFHRFLTCVLFTISTTVNGQIITISGPTNVNIGETHEYSVSLGNISPVSSTWTAVGGTVQSPSLRSADVLWTQAEGGDNKVTFFMEDELGNFYLGVLQVTVQVPVPNTTF
jgi:hypothetical protein